MFAETLMGGAFSEYVSAPENVCAAMPEGTEFSQMASVPVAVQIAKAFGTRVTFDFIIT